MPKLLLSFSCWLFLFMAWTWTYAVEPKFTFSQQERLTANPEVLLDTNQGLRPDVQRQTDGTLVNIKADLVARINELTAANIRLLGGSWRDVIQQTKWSEFHNLAMFVAHSKHAGYFFLSDVIDKNSHYIFSHDNSPLQAMADLVEAAISRLVLLSDFQKRKDHRSFPSTCAYAERSRGTTSATLNTSCAERSRSTCAERSRSMGNQSGSTVSHRHMSSALSTSVDAWRLASQRKHWKLANLLRHKVGAVLNRLASLVVIRKSLFLNLGIAFTVFDSESIIVYAIRKAYPELLSLINKTQAAINPEEVHSLHEQIGHLPANGLPLTEAERVWLEQHPKIVLGISSQFQPDIIVNPDGGYDGLVADYFALLNQQLGERLVLHVEESWSAITKKALKREIDGLASSVKNPIWDQHFLYSDPYYYGYFHLFARNAASPFNNLQALAGKRLGYLAGTRNAEHLLQQHPDIIPVALESNAAMASALLEKRVDALLGLIDFEWWRKQNSLLSIQIVGLVDQNSHPILMSIRNDWLLAQGIINKALRAIPREQKNRIHQRWLRSLPTRKQAFHLTAEERAYLNRHVFQRLQEKDRMPFSFIGDSGVVEGIGEDYWQLIRTKLSLREHTSKAINFAAVLAKMQSGEADVYPITTRIAEREAYALFTDSYEQYPVGVAAHRKTTFIADVATLQGEVVAVGKNYSAYHLLKARYPGIEFQQVRDTQAALEAVASRQAIAAVDILPVLQYHIEQFGTEVRLVGITDIPFKLQIMVHKNQARLVPLLNRAIAAITPQERLRIHKKWMNKSVVLHEWNYTAFWEIAVVALLIIGLMGYWNRKLARAQAQLHLVNARLQAIFANTNTGIGIFKQHQFMEVNHYLAQVLGYQPEELIGQSTRLIHLDEAHYAKFGQCLYPCLERDRQCSLEYPLRHHDGHTVWLYLSATSLTEQGASDEIALVGIDITERRHMEQKLREERAIAQRYFDTVQTLMVALDCEGNITMLNRVGCELLGYHEAELLGKSWFDICLPQPEGWEVVYPIFQQIMSKNLEGHEYLEHVVLRCDGSRRLLAWHNAYLHDDSGRLIGTLSSGEDITERKAAERQLQQTDEYLRSILASMDDLVFVLDAKGYFLDSHQRDHKHLFRPRAEFLGKHYWEILPARLCYQLDKAIATAREGEAQRFEYTLPLAGDKRWFSATLSARYDSAEHYNGSTVVVRDITALREAIQHRAAAEQFTRSIIDALSVHLCVLDENGVILTVNQAWRDFAAANLSTPQQYGVSSTYLGIYDGSCHQEDDIAREFAEQLQQVLTGKQSRFQYEYPCSLDDTKRWFVAHVNRFQNAGAAYVVVANEDITARHLAEEEIRASEQRYRSLIAAMTEGVVLQNHAGEIIECNEAAERILGMSWSQMKGLTSLDPHWRAICEDGSPFPGEQHPLPMVLRTGQAQINVIHGVHKPDGELRWISINAIPLFHAGEKLPYAAVATFSDITDMRNSRMELEKQRRTLQAVLDHAPVAIQVYAPDGTTRLSNPMAARLFGQKIAAADAKLTDLNPIYSVFIHDTDTLYPNDKMPLMRALLGETCMVEDMELRRPDGSRVLLQVNAAPLRDEEDATRGKVSAAIVMFQDITERWQTQHDLDRERRRLRVLVNTIPDLIWYKDTEGRYLGCNRRFESFFGANEALIKGKTDYDFVDQAQADFFRYHDRRAMVTDDPVVNEEEITFTDGHKELLETTKVVMRDRHGQIFGVLGIGHDITERKRTEQDLIQAREAAEAANRAKSAFLANMSHELRTPLNAVLGFAQITLESTKLPEDLHTYIEKIRRSGEYLLTLINDILDLSKVEAGRIELFPQEIELQSFFAEIVDMFRFRAEQKGIAFHYRPDTSLPHCLQADPKRLRQVLLNLLGNAVKFTDHGYVVLSAAYHGNDLQLCVEDTGLGIATAHLEEIFRPFAQTGENRYKTQGTGLGLSITHKIVELMNGKITLNSELGKGSRFYVHIPLEVSVDHSATQSESIANSTPLAEIIGYRILDSNQDKPEAPLRIFIVDDIADNREVLRYMLQPLGFSVAEADSGESCLQQAPPFQPDVVLMDMRMPELNGLETMQRLHSLPGLENLPVIIVSASVFHEDREIALQLGGADYLCKPVEQQTLLHTLRKHLRLEWEYAATTLEQATVPQETLVFPADWLAELEQAVVMGASQRIRALLAKRHEQGGTIPTQLQTWVEEYQYRQILEWIAQQLEQ